MGSIRWMGYGGKTLMGGVYVTVSYPRRSRRRDNRPFSIAFLLFMMFGFLSIGFRPGERALG